MILVHSLILALNWDVIWPNRYRSSFISSFIKWLTAQEIQMDKSSVNNILQITLYSLFISVNPKWWPINGMADKIPVDNVYKMYNLFCLSLKYEFNGS